MKTIQFAVLMLITMGMMVGCQKNNYSPAIDPVNSSIETADKLGRDEVTINLKILWTELITHIFH